MSVPLQTLPSPSWKDREGTSDITPPVSPPTPAPPGPVHPTAPTYPTMTPCTPTWPTVPTTALCTHPNLDPLYPCHHICNRGYICAFPWHHIRFPWPYDSPVPHHVTRVPHHALVPTCGFVPVCLQGAYCVVYVPQGVVKLCYVFCCFRDAIYIFSFFLF